MENRFKQIVTKSITEKKPIVLDEGILSSLKKLFVTSKLKLNLKILKNKIYKLELLTSTFRVPRDVSSYVQKLSLAMGHVESLEGAKIDMNKILKFMDLNIDWVVDVLNVEVKADIEEQMRLFGVVNMRLTNKKDKKFIEEFIELVTIGKIQ